MAGPPVRATSVTQPRANGFFIQRHVKDLGSRRCALDEDDGGRGQAKPTGHQLQHRGVRRTIHRWRCNPDAEVATCIETSNRVARGARDESNLETHTRTLLQASRILSRQELTWGLEHLFPTPYTSPIRNRKMADGATSEVNMATDDKQRALELALGQIEKQYGRGAIMRLGEGESSMEVAAISTGSLSVDIALGIGGIPRGRVTEIYGPESAGKSTLAQHIIAEAQRKGGTAAYIDVEHAMDPSYAADLGIKLEDLLVSQPDTGEQALEICEALVRSNAVDAIVIDSVAALVPRAEIEGEMGDAHVGLQARLMSQALRKLTGTIARTSTSVIFINQLREKVGIVFGNPEVTPGGRALKFYSSVRIELRRVESLKKGTDVIGNRVKAKIVKNKVAAPFRQAEFDIMFQSPRGISLTGDIVDLGVEYGVLTKSGAFYSYGDLRIGQGRENSKEFLGENHDIRNEIETEIRREAGLPPRDVLPAADAVASAVS